MQQGVQGMCVKTGAECFHWRSCCLTQPSCSGLGRGVLKITPSFRIKKGERKVHLGLSLAHAVPFPAPSTLLP